MLKKIFSHILIGIFVFSAGNCQAVLIKAGDPWLKYQDYLEQTRALEAWQIVNQSSRVVVAVIDSGVDIEHPDLYENIWRNEKEIPNDGLDNDGNGFIDDVNGWDFITNTPDPRPKFSGRFSKLGIDHGAIVSGIIGAVGDNGLGIVGVTWKVKIMPLRVMDGEGVGSTEAVIAAIKYAIDNGADIINLSMVGSVMDQKLADVITEAYNKGLIIVASAGNEQLGPNNSDVSLNLDLTPQYPICHDGEAGENHVLGVGAVDAYDVKSFVSNYGAKCLDVMAPGENFFGLLYFSPVIPGYNHYYGGYWTGTSLSAPLVSGAAALIKAVRPDLTNKDIYKIIKNTADDISFRNYLYPKQLGAGRLNIEAAVMAALQTDPWSGTFLSVDDAGRRVNIIDSQGKVKNFFQLADKQSGKITSLATGDFNRDGQREIAVALDSDRAGAKIIFFNRQGVELKSFTAWENKSAPNGIGLIAGDFNGDGVIDLAAAPLSGGVSTVKFFSYPDKLLGEIAVFDQSFRGGLAITPIDVNVDGVSELAIAPADGYRPEVRIYNFAGKKLLDFLSFDKNWTSGLKIASVNLAGDIRNEIIVAIKNNNQQWLRVFNPEGGVEQQWLLPSGADFSAVLGGIVNVSLTGEIVVAQKKALRIYQLNTSQPAEILLPKGTDVNNFIFY